MVDINCTELLLIVWIEPLISAQHRILESQSRVATIHQRLKVLKRKLDNYPDPK